MNLFLAVIRWLGRVAYRFVGLVVLLIVFFTVPVWAPLLWVLFRVDMTDVLDAVIELATLK